MTDRRCAPENSSTPSTDPVTVTDVTGGEGAQVLLSSNPVQCHVPADLIAWLEAQARRENKNPRRIVLRALRKEQQRLSRAGKKSN